MARTIHQQKHHNYLMLAFGIGLAIFLSKSPIFNHFLLGLGEYGYLSALVAGAMFVCTFTVATGALIIFTLVKTLNPFVLILFGMMGAVIFDIIVFSSVKDSIDEEIKEAFNNPHFSHFKKVLHTKYFAWMMPLFGLLVFLSPLPDELGIGLMGLSKFRTYQFVLISILNHSIGMSFIVASLKFLS